MPGACTKSADLTSSCLVQLLDRDLEVAEEQHQTALGAHLMVLDSLLDLQVRNACGFGGLGQGHCGNNTTQHCSWPCVARISAMQACFSPRPCLSATV